MGVNSTIHDPDRRQGQRSQDTTVQDTSRKGGLLGWLPLEGRAQRIAEWVALALAVYVLITAVGAIGDGFSLATGGQAEELFSFAENPFVGLAIGIGATVLTQSSTTTTSIVVGMVAGGLPLEIAIPILLGSNVGTTVTSTLVSLGAAGDREHFRRAFSAASVHDMYNLIAVIIFFPLEWMFGILESSARWFAEVTTGADGGIIATVLTAIGDVTATITDPGAELLGDVAEAILPPVWAGIVMVVVGIALILLVIRFIAALLKSLLVGKAEKVFHNAVGRGPLTGLAAGLVVTLLVQSSSTTTSLAVPLAASGKFSLKQVFPYTVGANIGTTATAIIAAFGFTGIERTAGMTAAAVHLIYNVLAAALIMTLPGLRTLPIRLAAWIGDLGARNKIYVVVWVVGVFIAVPAALILLTAVL